MTVTNNSELNQVKNCTIWTGRLTIDPNFSVSNITFTKLSKIYGTLDISNVNTLTSLDFPALTFIETLEVVSNPNLSSISVPNLVKAGDYSFGGITISDNASLPEIDLSTLINVNGTLRIEDNPMVENIDLADLSSVDFWIYINNNDSLLFLFIPAPDILYFEAQDNDILSEAMLLCQNAESVKFENNASLRNIKLPDLQTNNNHIKIVRNPLLAAADFPSLTYTGGMQIYENDIMASLTFQTLAQTKIITIYDNLNLSLIRFPALIEMPTLNQSSARGIIENNAVSQNGLDLSALILFDEMTIDEPAWTGGCSYFSTSSYNSLTVNGTSC